MANDIRLLAVIGELLYGTRWQADMADALGVSRRAIRRWLAEGDIPKGVWDDLHAMLLERQARLGALIETVEHRDVN